MFGGIIVFCTFAPQINKNPPFGAEKYNKMYLKL